MNHRPQQFEVKRDRHGRFYWTLFVRDEALCESQHYKTHEECITSIRTVGELAGHTQINDTIEGRWRKKP